MWLSTPPGAGKKKSLTIAMLYVGFDILAVSSEQNWASRCRCAHFMTDSEACRVISITCKSLRALRGSWMASNVRDVSLDGRAMK